MADGTLNAPLMQSQREGTENYNFLLYNKDNGETVHLEGITVTTTNGVSKASSLTDADGKNYKGYMFVMGAAKPSKRVYRVTEIAIEEEEKSALRQLSTRAFCMTTPLEQGLPISVAACLT